MERNFLTRVPDDVVTQVRQTLLRLAKREDDLAAEESARVAYWQPSSPFVAGHRAAAQALRNEADALLASAS